MLSQAYVADSTHDMPPACISNFNITYFPNCFNPLQTLMAQVLGSSHTRCRAVHGCCCIVETSVFNRRPDTLREGAHQLIIAGWMFYYS